MYMVTYIFVPFYLLARTQLCTKLYMMICAWLCTYMYVHGDAQKAHDLVRPAVEAVLWVREDSSRKGFAGNPGGVALAIADVVCGLWALPLRVYAMGL